MAEAARENGVGELASRCVAVMCLPVLMGTCERERATGDKKSTRHTVSHRPLKEKGGPKTLRRAKEARRRRPQSLEGSRSVPSVPLSPRAPRPTGPPRTGAPRRCVPAAYVRPDSRVRTRVSHGAKACAWPSVAHGHWQSQRALVASAHSGAYCLTYSSTLTPCPVCRESERLSF